MTKRLIPALALALGSVVLIQAHLDVPPPGHTGAPGEATCAATGCHEGADTGNSPSLRFVTFDTYSEEVSIRVILGEGDAGFQTDRVGFQAVVLDPSGNTIGALSSNNMYVQIDTGVGGRMYASQTKIGASKSIGSGAISYRFTWARDEVDADTGIVYAVGLWSNGDSTRLGDAQLQATLELKPCPVRVTGDVNLSGSGTSADIIYMVNYIFRGGAEPLPCEAAGDVNCDGVITAADIIYIVNWLFKITEPCDVCPLIWAGIWDCG